MNRDSLDMRTAVTSPIESGDSLHALMQLRCRQEILQRWLASEVLPAGLQQGLRAMLAEVEEQLRALSSIAPN